YSESGHDRRNQDLHARERRFEWHVAVPAAIARPRSSLGGLVATSLWKGYFYDQCRSSRTGPKTAICASSIPSPIGWSAAGSIPTASPSSAPCAPSGAE